MSGQPLSRAIVVGTRVTEGHQPVVEVVAVGGTFVIGRYQVVSGADGRYEIRDLPPGSYSVRASRTGYATAPFGGRSILSRPGVVNVAAGATAEDVDLRLLPACVISGRLLDHFGEPLVNARVEAHRGGLSTSGGLPLARVYSVETTDDRGEFRIHGLPAGRYLISARASFTAASRDEASGLEYGYPPTYYPGVVAAGQATPVSVRPGETVGNIDFTVLPVPVASIQGNVLDSAGNPAAPRLTLVRLDSGRESQVAGLRISVSRTTGAFEVSGLSPGEYRLTARTEQGPSGGPEAAAARLVVAGGDVAGVMVVMTKASRIAGHVRTRGTGSPPLEQLQVCGASDTMFPLSTPETRASRVDRDGRFEIRGLLGRRSLQVRWLPAGWMVEGIFRGDQDVTETTFDLAGGEDIRDVEVVLTDRLTHVVGRVVDVAGTPAADCAVVVFSATPARWPYGTRAVQITRPDTGGRFLVDGLAPGEYLAAAIAPPEAGEWADPGVLEETRPVATRVTVMQGEPVDIVLTYRRGGEAR